MCCRAVCASRFTPFTLCTDGGRYADEGNAEAAERLRQLDKLKAELDCIAQGGKPQTALMQCLHNEVIEPFQLPLQPFYDLLAAFSQDVVKTRYENFGELIAYCRLSANPVGRIMLHLYGQTDEVSMAQSDGICTALQLINFWQDVAVDWQKRARVHPSGRFAEVQSQRRADCGRQS